MIAIGDLYPVWWETFRKDKNDNPLAIVKDIRPYTGRYKEFFTHDLVLEAPLTRKGTLEMSVKLDS
jgi:hypothetical protein